MCDVRKYSDMFKDIRNLQPEDTLQLVLEAKDEEEREFFEMLGNFLLQQKQKRLLKGTCFDEKIYFNCDLVVLYDNTKAFSRFAIYKNGDLYTITENVPMWFEKYIM